MAVSPCRALLHFAAQFWVLSSVLRLPSRAWCDVLQQQMKTMTVVQDALNDPTFPSLPGSSNDVADTQTWTNNNQNVRTDSSITIAFNENIQVGMGYITFQPPISGGLGSSSSAATTISVPSTGISVSGKSLIINAARSAMHFTESTTYTLSIDAGVILDLGSPVDTNAAFSVQFTVGDFTSPTRTGITPADNSPAVDFNGKTIVLTFNEAIQANPGGVGITVEDPYMRQTPSSKYYACKSSNVVISGNKATLTIDPAGFAIAACQRYRMEYTSRCFYDTSPNHNYVASLTATAYYDFWTSCITTYSPLHLSLDNLISTNIVLTFKEEIVQGTGNIVLTPLGENPINFAISDLTRVKFNTPTTKQITIVGNIPTSYLCVGTIMQDCKGKPMDLTIAAGVINRAYTSSPAPSTTLPTALNQQLTGSAYRFTMKPADLTPPIITIVSMYGISESVIRVTVRLDESGTTYCRGYDGGNFTPTSQSGSNVPTLTDCDACNYEIKTSFGLTDPLYNFMGDSTYDPIRKYAEHEVDVTHLTAKTFYWVYCFSHDIEIPTNNVVTSAQMIRTERKVRTLDTTPPTFGTFTCVPTLLKEDSITVTLDMNEVGRAYCKVVNRNFSRPSPNAVIAEAFYADVITAHSTFTIKVDQITTGLGATGMESLFRKTDYDVYCWSQDGEGYPYHGPNGMADVVACSTNYVTTLDLTKPNMRFIFAESISHSQIIITLQVDEGSRVWCAAWAQGNDPVLTPLNYEAKIKGNAASCMDNKGRQCGTFWIYDLDDIEDSALDGVTSRATYDDVANWKFNQDVDIIVYKLIEKTTYPHIYCFAEDDETDGIGSSPNKMLFDSAANAGPKNVHTISLGIGTISTLDESPPSFTQLSMLDPTAFNDRIIVTFSMNEAGTAYCRVTRSDSGETTLRINRILSADYHGLVASSNVTQYITIDKLETRDALSLYEAAQYDVYCWARDSAVDTQGLSRPNYQIQDYVDNPVGTTLANALTSPKGGKTTSVWVKDLTPPIIIYVSSEALTEEVIQITIQLNEPGTVWCQPVLPGIDGTRVNVADVTVGNYKSYIRGRSGTATFMEYVHYPFINVDVEVSKIELDSGSTSQALKKEIAYNVYCFAEDDWQIQAQSSAMHSIDFATSNVGSPNEVPFVQSVNFKDVMGLITTLDLTPPSISITGVSSTETTITVTLKLDETGTAWCQAVRKGFNVPTILEILDTNFYNTYTYNPMAPSGVTTVVLTGYDRPKNAYNDYVTPLVLGVDYDIYCYADDNLCRGCKVTNGVSFSAVTNAHTFIRTKDTTRPHMRFVFAESIKRDQIIITLQVDEGSRVWCGAWITDPGLTSLNYITTLKNYPTCKDNKGRQCGTFWIYDLDDLEDVPGNDGVATRADYDKWENWKYNQDVDIILSGLVEEQDYPYIYCYAEDDEQDGIGSVFADTNKMLWAVTAAGNGTSDNVYTMGKEIGTIQTLDDSPPSFTYLAIQDPTAFNDRIIVTFKLNEAGTAYCRVTRTDSGETTLRINQVLSANYGYEVVSPTATGYITIDKLETRDDKVLYEAAQYDVYCWAKDSAVDTQSMTRPNYVIQDYLEANTNAIAAPKGGRSQYVWVKDMTPPTIIFVSREALTESIIQITLQLTEPGTVWCHPAVPNISSAYAATYMAINDVTAATYISYIKGRGASFMEYVHVPYVNVDVEVNKLAKDTGLSADLLLKSTPYNIYCFAEDDWKIQAVNAVKKSINFNVANAATPNMTVGNGNEIGFTHAVQVRDAIGLVTTLDLTPPSITMVGLSATETTITVTARLDETGTIWCQAVRKGFNVPTILEILDSNFFNTYTYAAGTALATTEIALIGYDRPKNAYNDYVTPLVLGVDYDVYCYADDHLCLGCKVTNGVSFLAVTSTLKFIRTKDLTRPHMRYITSESIARDQIIVTLQVDEGSRVWCAAWQIQPSPAFADTAIAITAIKAKENSCFDGRGRKCGTFWIYDLDDLEDAPGDGVETRADYDKWDNWKYNQDVDIIIYGLTEKLDYNYIYCYAEDDETIVNTMRFNTSAAAAGSDNMYTMQQEIGIVQTLDESPPSFTRLALKDPTAYNDRLIITFQLNEAGTAYCRTTRSDSGEATLRINQILTADYSAVVLVSTATAYITVDKLETRDTRVLYEAAQYDVYCWAKDSATDTQTLARPNYMVQDYVQTLVGNPTSTPKGGKTSKVWILDATPPVIIVVSREALAEDTIQVTLQLNEPGTIWCQIADKDSSAAATGTHCRGMDVTFAPSTDKCFFETWIKGVSRAGFGTTLFRADVHVPYQDYDINLNHIENVGVTAGESLVAQYNYHVWCFAEDDWKIEAMAKKVTAEFANPLGPNKVLWAHAQSVSDTIGQVLTLDQTPPTWTTISGTQYAESVLQMTMTLDETGTIWCQPVRKNFAEPSINEILQNNEYNSACGITACTVAMQGLQSKTQYDIWCYTEDDNLYPQTPNGRKFSALQKTTLSTLDTTPPILTIVSAESPISSDIRIKVKMEEPGQVWCNSFVNGAAYGVVTFDAVVAGGYTAYVGQVGLTPGGPINQNVEVIVANRVSQTAYDTYCTAQDKSTLPTINKMTGPKTISTSPAVGLITTLDQSPPTFTVLGASGIDENTVQVTFRCNEPCRAYCRVTRSDSGETSLNINRILKADFQAAWTTGDQTIQLNRLEDDSALSKLERGTLYDTYCWIRDEAVQWSCYAQGAGANCATYPKPNYQSQVYLDTAFGGTPPSTVRTPTIPAGGKILHVRTPDTTPPMVVFVEAESTEETSITVTLQLDEPGTAYCKAFVTVQSATSTLYTALTTGTVYKNTVTNWNNVYRNFEVLVSDLSMEKKYYVYCVAEDDELMEGTYTIIPKPTKNNQATPMLIESTGRFTLDLTPPIISVVGISSYSESTATVTLKLDEPGTVWCKAVRDRFDPPTINQIIAANFLSVTTSANTNFDVLVQNLLRDTEYDMYCHGRDRGTEVDPGTPLAGNPGNDVSNSHMLTTKRDIHTMGDSTAPVVTSRTPVLGETNVGRNPVFTLQFNEDIQSGTGNVIFTPSGGGPTVNLDITKANTNICVVSLAKLFITLNVLSVDFSACSSGGSYLSANTQWYVSFAAGVLKDDSNAQNVAPAFGSGSSYYFTTGTR